MFGVEFIEDDERFEGGYLVNPEFQAPGEWCAIEIFLRSEGPGMIGCHMFNDFTETSRAFVSLRR